MFPTVISIWQIIIPIVTALVVCGIIELLRFLGLLPW